MRLITILLPSQQNSIQKIGFVVSLSIAILTTFLHFPFDGYVTEHSVTRTIRYALKPCPYAKPSLDAVLKMNKEQLDRSLQETKECNDESVTEVHPLPISEWRSQAPIIEWLGSFTHYITTLILIFFMDAVWFFGFQSHDEKSNSN